MVLWGEEEFVGELQSEVTETALEYKAHIEAAGKGLN